MYMVGCVSYGKHFFGDFQKLRVADVCKKTPPNQLDLFFV
jgi:hypothetical protein